MTPDDFENELHAAVGKPRAEWRTRSVGHSVTRELVKEPGAHRTSWAEAFITLSSPQSIKLTVKMKRFANDPSLSFPWESNIADLGNPPPHGLEVGEVHFEKKR